MCFRSAARTNLDTVSKSDSLLKVALSQSESKNDALTFKRAQKTVQSNFNRFSNPTSEWYHFPKHYLANTPTRYQILFLVLEIQQLAKLSP